MKSRSAFVPGVLFLAVALSSCTGGDKSIPPKQQFDAVIEHVRGGQLVSAFDAFLPPSFVRGVDDVLSKVSQLVGEDEYTELREALSSGGTKLAGLLALSGIGHPVIRLGVEKLKQIPAVLGIDTYERFQGLNVASLLRALETGIVRELLEIETVQQNLSVVSFELKKRQRDWARLVVRFQPSDGDALVDEMELIRFEGRWVPAPWVTDWPAIVEAWRDQVEAALKLKAEAPAAFEKSLAAFVQAMQNPASLLQTLPELGKLLGMTKTAAE